MFGKEPNLVEKSSGNVDTKVDTHESNDSKFQAMMDTVKDALKLRGVNGHEREFEVFQNRIRPAFDEALETNNQISKAVFDQRLNLLINRTSFKQIYKNRATVSAAATAFMGTLLGNTRR